MAYEFAGAYDAAALDTNSQLLKLVAFELVTEPGGVLATLYTDRLRSAVVPQPFLSDAEGNVHLFTDPGRYRLRQAGSPPGEEITVQPDPDESETELEAHTSLGLPTHGGGGVSDHGALTGLADDDHPQYQTAPESQAQVDAHTTDPVDAHDASAVSNVPSGTVAATDVQAAINELDAEKLSTTAHNALDHSPVAGTINLDELGDVDAPTPADQDVLTFDAVSGDWINAPGGGAGDKNYVHTQTVPSTLWVVTHNLAKFGAVTVVQGAPQRLAPDVLLTQLNLAGVVAEIQDDPDAPDGSWLERIVPAAQTTGAVSFPTPASSPIGVQEFRFLLRAPDGPAVVTLQLRETGAPTALLSVLVPITSAVGEIVSLVWDASLLVNPTGAEVIALAESNNLTPSIEVGAIEWNASSEERVVYPDIVYLDENTVQIEFTDPSTGRVFVN